jgi:hypothetical protein
VSSFRQAYVRDGVLLAGRVTIELSHGNHGWTALVTSTDDDCLNYGPSRELRDLLTAISEDFD